MVIYFLNIFARDYMTGCFVIIIIMLIAYILYLRRKIADECDNADTESFAPKDIIAFGTVLAGHKHSKK